MYRIKVDPEPGVFPQRFRWHVWGPIEAAGTAPTEHEAWRLAHLAAEGYPAV